MNATLPPRRLLRRVVPFVLALFAITACSDVTGPLPTPTAPPLAPRLPVAAQPEAAVIGTVLVAEWQRVGTSLPQNSQSDALNRALTAIAGPLKSGVSLSTELADARGALASYEPSVQGSAAAKADVDSIRLLLDALQKFLDGLR